MEMIVAQNRFKDFVKSVQGDAVRDFTLDAVQDNNLPDATSWPEREAYLKAQEGIADSTLSAARYVWDRYEAEVLSKDR